MTLIDNGLYAYKKRQVVFDVHDVRFLQVAQLWQRPRELDQTFQVGGQFEAKL